MAKQYEITDKDIESALLYLKHNDPESATREKAVALLNDLQQSYHNIAHTNPALLDELQKELSENRKVKD